MDPDDDTPAPADEVLQLVVGTWQASRNCLDANDGPVVMHQVDQHVSTMGNDGCQIARHDLADWLKATDRPEPPLIDCFDAEGAWEMLTHLRRDCLVWQCGACDAWRPRSASRAAK